jgi:hypothetical protein
VRPVLLASTDGTPLTGRVQDAILEALERGYVTLRAGEVSDVIMLHDDDCPALRAAPCRCQPEVVPHARGAA